MSSKEQWNGNLPRDISQTAYDYINERGISKSELVRRGIIRLLEEEGYQ